MTSTKKEKVVIIGGGIAGLTAGAYLARAGVDVELFEQHYRLGGCCTSFKRRKFIFDAAVHGVGGCRPGGFIYETFKNLELWDRIEMLRSDPMDVVLCPEYYVPIWTDTEKFLGELKTAFPKEIDRLTTFINFLNSFSLHDLAKWGKATFRDLLDHYLQDNLAKTLFIPPLGNLGMSSRRMDATYACALWRENQLNGGYAPKGGFQTMADLMGKRIEEYGGKVNLRQEVSRIEMDGNRVTGVKTRAMLKGVGEDREINTRYVLGAGSAPHMYYDLIGREKLPADLINDIETLEYSISGIAAFLGLKVDLNKHIKHGGNHWYFPNPDLDAVDGWVEQETMVKHLYDEDGPFYFAQPTHYDPSLAPAGKSVLIVMFAAPYHPREYWKAEGRQERLGEVAIKRASRVIPNLKDLIEINHVATPATLEWFTRNAKGSWYGWAGTNTQSNLKRMGRKTQFDGLYLAGHWTRPGGGLINCLKSGHLAAKAMLRDIGADSSHKNPTFDQVMTDGASA